MFFCIQHLISIPFHGPEQDEDIYYGNNPSKFCQHHFSPFFHQQKFSIPHLTSSLNFNILSSEANFCNSNL